MDYSVFDWSARQYRVYRDGRLAPLMADTPACRPAVAPVQGLLDVNAALCVVPPDAKFVRMSATAVGQVARLSSGMAGVPSGGARRGSPNLGGTE